LLGPLAFVFKVVDEGTLGCLSPEGVGVQGHPMPPSLATPLAGLEGK